MKQYTATVVVEIEVEVPFRVPKYDISFGGSIAFESWKDRLDRACDAAHDLVSVVEGGLGNIVGQRVRQVVDEDGEVFAER